MNFSESRLVFINGSPESRSSAPEKSEAMKARLLAKEVDDVRGQLTKVQGPMRKQALKRAQESMELQEKLRIGIYNNSIRRHAEEFLALGRSLLGREEVYGDQTKILLKKNKV